MGAIEDYRARREARLSAKRAERIDAFRGRREKRLIARGILPVEYRSDAPEEEQENNNSESSGGSHGNTRLPFGLCMRYGIPIEPSWGPSEAWEALKSKGITPEGAFSRLKEGKDPGTPDEGGDPGSEKAGEAEKVEPPKEPVKSVRIKTYAGDVDYDKLEGKFDTWAGRGTDKWVLFGSRVEGSYEGMGWRTPPKVMSERFHTKMDMFRWLKDRGIEEFPDPETGEIVNPVEMEIPTPVMTIGKTGYTGVSIGFRGGGYGIVATDYDGKKKTIETLGSLEAAKEYAKRYGAKEEDIKISPATKKREAERVSWLTSDKKEYFEDGGKKFGDIHIEDRGRWIVTGESEDGETKRKVFRTKTEAMSYLKDQGVQKAKYGKESLDPQGYEIPETVVEIGGTPMQDVGLKASGYGSDYYLYGKDLDGKVTALTYRYGGESHEEFLKRIKDTYGIGGDKLTIDPDSKEKIDKIEKAEKEFEEKAETFGDKRYTDIHIEKDDFDGSYRLVGHDRRGEERWIEGGGWYSLERDINRYGKDISQYIKDEDLRKSYDEYKEKMKDFDAKAVEIAGERYADIKISTDGRRFYVKGTDAIGREETIAEERYYEDLEKTLGQYGFTPTSFEMTDDAKKKRDKAVRAKELIATGEYYSLGMKDEAFKDIRFKRDADARTYRLTATDADGNTKLIDHDLTWDKAIEKMNDLGVNDYKFVGTDGEEMPKPRWGMHGVVLERKVGGGFLVYADSHKYGKHAVMYETPNESEARKWLKDNNVPDDGIKTRGMNPNDDVPRTHTAKSLENFDTHRMNKAEEWEMLRDMDESTKTETAEMLTEMFDKGAYRMNRRDHFAQIVDHGFKNLLETGTSGGSSYKPGRRETGVESFGHPYDMPASEAERYGFWGLDDDSDAADDYAARGYGRIMFKFKKDKVAERATYTFGDTLDTGRPLPGYAGSKPTIEGVTALDEYGYGNEHLKNILDAYHDYKRGSINFTDFHEKVSGMCGDGYVECHYHGPLGIEDVDTITFDSHSLRDTFKGMKPETRKRIVKKLKDSGIVMQYKSGGEMHDAYEWIKEMYGED